MLGEAEGFVMVQTLSRMTLDRIGIGMVGSRKSREVVDVR
jgi:hypothetical protein